MGLLPLLPVLPAQTKTMACAVPACTTELNAPIAPPSKAKPAASQQQTSVPDKPCIIVDTTDAPQKEHASKATNVAWLA